MILCTVEQFNVEFKLFRNQTGTDSSDGSKGWGWGRGCEGRSHPLGSKFFRFHAVFGKIWQNRMLAAPYLWRVGAPTSGESWIRHWIGQYIIDHIPSKRSLQM